MMKVVRYGDFGARGDGKSDDTEAIFAAHAHANQQGLPVQADDAATYYIGGKDLPVVIETDTDFGKAQFIIDDRTVANRAAPVFLVNSKLKPFKLTGVTALKKNQRHIEASLPGPCLITVVNTNVKNYIRFGGNQNTGAALTDVFLVDAAGNVDPTAPIMWDFVQITGLEAQPIDPTPLTIRGGRFTTIANAVESKYTCYARGISIQRSQVEIVGLEHYVQGEGDHGAPYVGFITIRESANVTVRDAILTGHKTYWTIGQAGTPVPMGSYDILPNRSINVSLLNCRQSNDLLDNKYWGIMASNYSKNLRYDGCNLSRFDAHMGVFNATIRNSTIGHAGINAIGHGTLLVENTTVHGGSLVNLRQDYGSTWDGEFIIRNCVFVPTGVAKLINGHNEGQHDFGYICHMPWRITIDGLRIDGGKSVAVFGDFNPKLSEPGYVEKYPIVRPMEVLLKNVTTASGQPLRLSDNLVLFKDVKVVLENTNLQGR